MKSSAIGDHFCWLGELKGHGFRCQFVLSGLRSSERLFREVIKEALLGVLALVTATVDGVESAYCSVELSSRRRSATTWEEMLAEN